MQMTIQAAKQAEPEGLKDGGHVYVSCSNCDAGLLDVWRTRPHEKEVWHVRASCPFCGGRSYAVEIKGGFHVGGYGTPKPGDGDETIPSTIYTGQVSVEDNVFLFKTIKANENAVPVKVR